MSIIIATISIWVIGGIAWLIGKNSGTKLCPICFGVSGTWMWMLAALYFGYSADARIIAILMGGSVVGAAYLAVKYLPGRQAGLPEGRSAALWKLLIIPVGFALVSVILAFNWVIAGVALAIVAVIAYFFFGRTDKTLVRTSRIDDLEKQMEDCC